MSNDKEYSDITAQNIDKVFAERYATFGSATVKDRAIPSVNDGLNPVTRRIVYTFYKENNGDKFRKAAMFVGATLGGYHPHSR